MFCFRFVYIFSILIRIVFICWTFFGNLIVCWTLRPETTSHSKEYVFNMFGGTEKKGISRNSMISILLNGCSKRFNLDFSFTFCRWKSSVMTDDSNGILGTYNLVLQLEITYSDEWRTRRNLCRWVKNMKQSKNIYTIRLICVFLFLFCFVKNNSFFFKFWCMSTNYLKIFKICFLLWKS